MNRRRSAGIPTFIALPVVILSVILWVRSYAVQDVVRFARAGTEVALVSAPGRLLVHRTPQSANENRSPDWDTAAAGEGFSPGNLLHRPAYRATPDGGTSTATIPYWVPVLLGLIPPGWWATSSRRRRRRARRLSDTCLACGREITGHRRQCQHCGAPVV